MQTLQKEPTASPKRKPNVTVTAVILPHPQVGIASPEAHGPTFRLFAIHSEKPTYQASRSWHPIA
jgi:hypothetical protein